MPNTQGCWAAAVTGVYSLIRVFPSLWQLCPNEDCSRRWHSFLDHGTWQCQECRIIAALATELWPTAVFSLASGTWQSEGLLAGPSVLLGPFPALTRSRLGSFSVAGHVRGLEGAPFLLGCFQLSSADMCVWLGVCGGGGGGYRDGSTPVCDSAALPCLLVCLSFLLQHFPLHLPQVPWAVCPQSTADLAWGLLCGHCAPALPLSMPSPRTHDPGRGM